MSTNREQWVFRMQLPANVGNSGRFVAGILKRLLRTWGVKCIALEESAEGEAPPKDHRRLGGKSSGSERVADAQGRRERRKMTWYGWIWTGDRWERVCTAPSINECSHQLGRIGEERNIPCRFQCLTGGAAPSFRPARARKERP